MKTVTAVVTHVDTTRFYVVLKATSVTDGRHYTVLSPRTDKSGRVLSASVLSPVAIGGRYTFRLQETHTMQVMPAEPPLLLNLRGLRLGDVHIVDSGEAPYLALNMCGFNIY